MVGNQEYLVQVQRRGVRRTRRGKGSEADAQEIESQLIAEIDLQLKREEAATLLGVDLAQTPAPSSTRQPPPDQRKPAHAPSPTLRAFFESRWIEHAKVVQNEGTRHTSRSPLNYILYYLSDKSLSDLLRPKEINAFVEAMKTNGGLSFAFNQDGTTRRRRSEVLTNATINKSLQCLKALLNLAHGEGIVMESPRIDMLPLDNSSPVIPPTEEEFDKLLAVCADFRTVAPLLPEVVQFTAETGLRRGEVFTLSWSSVELARSAVRVEMQARGRLVNGVAWRPKHNKWREVPLSAKARAVIDGLLKGRTPGEHDLVFQNKGGAPYERMDRFANAEGKGYYPDAVVAAGLKDRMTFHSLRHLFAVRLLTRGVPITVVSELLGHSDINLTVKRYGRFSSDAKVKWDAVKVLDSIGAEKTAPSESETTTPAQ
jgi:integrase